MEYKNILVPIDGSDGSRQALAFGTELAKKFDAELTIVYVIEEVALSPYGAGHPFTSQHPGVLEKEIVQPYSSVERNEEFLNTTKKEVQITHPNVTTQLLEGEPATAICNYADGKADLIVIGSRGLSGLKKLVLGSVSQKVVQEANCPVLVAK